MFIRRFETLGLERGELDLMETFCTEENWNRKLIVDLLGFLEIYLSSRKGF